MQTGWWEIRLRPEDEPGYSPPARGGVTAKQSGWWERACLQAAERQLPSSFHSLFSLHYLLTTSCVVDFPLPITHQPRFPIHHSRFLSLVGLSS